MEVDTSTNRLMAYQ